MSPRPAPPAKVSVEITSFGFEDHIPGAVVEVDPATARSLVDAGIARRPDTSTARPAETETSPKVALDKAK